MAAAASSMRVIPTRTRGRESTCAGAGGRTECPADTRYGVTLVRQVSTTRCVQGSTWGTNQNAGWVDRGCRGEFQIGSAAVGGETTKRITCGNPAGQQVTCPTSGSATGVRLVRDLSYGRCQEGQSWGHTDCSSGSTAGAGPIRGHLPRCQWSRAVAGRRGRNPADQLRVVY